MSITARVMQLEMGDLEDALTLENVYKRYASYAGIQKFAFSDDLSIWAAADWTSLSDASFLDSYITLSNPASDEIGWYSHPMPHSYTIEFTVHQGIWGMALRGDHVLNNYYLLHYHVVSGAGYIQLTRRYLGMTIPISYKELKDWEVKEYGRVRISVRDEQYTSDSPGRIIYISVWLNDVLIFTVANNVASSNPPLEMGMFIPSGLLGLLYSDLRIPNLGEIIIWSSLDPGEFPIGAIQRAAEDRYLKQWIRWDGALRAWSPKARDATAQITESKELTMSAILDLKQVFSHVRVLGAFQWVQVVEPSLINKVGNRFREISNSNLWNADDCNKIGLQLLMRSKEQADQIRIDTYGLHYTESEDRIQVPDRANPGSLLDYIVDSITWEYTNQTLRASFSLRRYFY